VNASSFVNYFSCCRNNSVAFGFKWLAAISIRVLHSHLNLQKHRCGTTTLSAKATVAPPCSNPIGDALQDSRALWLKKSSPASYQYSAAFALRCSWNMIAILKYFFFVECHIICFKKCKIKDDLQNRITIVILILKIDFPIFYKKNNSMPPKILFTFYWNSTCALFLPFWFWDSSSTGDLAFSRILFTLIPFFRI
jgi:hypothetical protein